MKKVLLIIGLIASVNLNAQNNAGIELQKAANHYYTGMGVFLCGGVLASSSIHYDNKRPLLFAGGLVSLVGSIIMLESHSHIYKAGKLLNKDVVYCPSSDGIGICLKF